MPHTTLTHHHFTTYHPTDYGVHRGIDFQAVSFVVNVDFPRSARAYTHRVGRTARGGANGTALSLVTKDDARQAATLAEVQASQPALPPLEGDTSLEALPAGGAAAGGDGGVGMGLGMRAQPAPLAFDLRELEGFRYRVEDVKRAVTKVAVKEARLAEIKQELLNSEALKGHFQENPHEFQVGSPVCSGVSGGLGRVWCVRSPPTSCTQHHQHPPDPATRQGPAPLAPRAGAPQARPRLPPPRGKLHVSHCVWMD